MSSLPTVMMLSLWRNDTQRNLRARALHLLSKSYPNLRLVWVEGDSSDDTYGQLLEILNEVRQRRRVDLLRADTGIVGNDVRTRRRRLSATANAGLALVQNDGYVLMHESDLLSPINVVERFVDHIDGGRCPIAGWPILPVGQQQAVFYDVWAYRKNGQLFSNTPPFHACYVPDTPFEVDSVGSVWMLHADDVRNGAHFDDMACVGLCGQLRERGRRIWVDPGLTIVQPHELWQPHSTAD